MARCQDVVTSGQPPVSVKSPLPSQWRDVSDCCPHLDPAQHCLVPGIYSSNPLGRYTTLEMLQTTTETHWDTLHNLPVTESLNWDNLWVLISLSELGCKIRVYLCIVLADKGGCKILYLRPSHCQSCWFLQLLYQLPETLFFICNSHRWWTLNWPEAAKNRGLVRSKFVTLGFAVDIDLLSTTFGV